MLVNVHLQYLLLLNTVMKEHNDNPDLNNKPDKSGLSYSDGLKAVATFAIPILIIIVILKLAGC